MNYSALLSSSIRSQTSNGESNSSSERMPKPVQVSSHRGRKDVGPASPKKGKEKD